MILSLIYIVVSYHSNQLRGLPSLVKGVRSDRFVRRDAQMLWYLTGLPHPSGVRGFESHPPHLGTFKTEFERILHCEVKTYSLN